MKDLDPVEGGSECRSSQAGKGTLAAVRGACGHHYRSLNHSGRWQWLPARPVCLLQTSSPGSGCACASLTTAMISSCPMFWVFWERSGNKEASDTWWLCSQWGFWLSSRRNNGQLVEIWFSYMCSGRCNWRKALGIAGKSSLTWWRCMHTLNFKDINFPIDFPGTIHALNIHEPF